jgi:hypothetical protein
MTTIAYKNGVIAADSRVTVDSEAGGSRNFHTEKLFRRRVNINGIEQEVIMATAGESAPGSLFVEQFGSGKSLPEIRDVFGDSDVDFTVLLVTQAGLFEVDKWCVMEPVYEPFYAIGSGAKLAMGAMEAGASAARAVEIACKRDPYTAPPVVTMRLKPNAKSNSAPLPEMPKPDAQSRNNSRRPDALAVSPRRRRKNPVLLNDQPAEAGNQQVGSIEQATGVQPGAGPDD